jgi:hypothetical protein
VGQKGIILWYVLLLGGEKSKTRERGGREGERESREDEREVEEGQFYGARPTPYTSSQRSESLSLNPCPCLD